jgi:hypothetical protein
MNTFAVLNCLVLLDLMSTHILEHLVALVK